MTRAERRTALLLASLVLQSACALRPPADSGPTGGMAPPLPADPVPRAEPRSRYGNGPIYEVYGRPYRVLDSSFGYRERGVASWYGRKFHGRPTSSRERYDMHALTAAHRTLPLPTYVRVRNLQNGRSVVVRVNDRGPFVDNRLIDLSYAAARRLALVRDGVGLVDVPALSFDAPPVAAADPAPAPAGTAIAEPGPPGEDAVRAGTVYLQVGAFGERGNAERRFRLLNGNGIGNAFVYRDDRPEAPLYRVRIGPIADVDQFDALVARLDELGIDESHLVTD